MNVVAFYAAGAVDDKTRFVYIERRIPCIGGIRHLFAVDKEVFVNILSHSIVNSRIKTVQIVRSAHTNIDSSISSV